MADLLACLDPDAPIQTAPAGSIDSAAVLPSDDDIF
jgi:hypothetical protein